MSGTPTVEEALASSSFVLRCGCRLGRVRVPGTTSSTMVCTWCGGTSKQHITLGVFDEIMERVRRDG